MFVNVRRNFSRNSIIVQLLCFELEEIISKIIIPFLRRQVSIGRQNNYHKNPDPSHLQIRSIIKSFIFLQNLSCSLFRCTIFNSSLSLSLSQSGEFLERTAKKNGRAGVSADNFMAHRVGMSRMDGN